MKTKSPVEPKSPRVDLDATRESLARVGLNHAADALERRPPRPPDRVAAAPPRPPGRALGAPDGSGPHGWRAAPAAASTAPVVATASSVNAAPPPDAEAGVASPLGNPGRLDLRRVLGLVIHDEGDMFEETLQVFELLQRLDEFLEAKAVMGWTPKEG